MGLDVPGDPVLRSFAARLTELGNEEAAAVLAGLVEGLQVEAVGNLMERLPPAGTLDYAAHSIRLLVSSTQIGVRLISVEKEPFTVEWIEESIRAGDVFYDIGANVGAYSLIAAKATSKRARVFAFEPAPASFLDLFRNVKLNECSESITPLPLALWSQTALLTLEGKTLAPGAAQHRIGRQPTEQGAATIVAFPLDDLVESFGLPVPTHAKIDTDGYEVDVLYGAARTLTRPEWKSVLIEVDRDETSRNEQIRTILADAGFGARQEHPRLPTPAFPDPESRPDVYWTFRRSASKGKRARADGRRSWSRRSRATPIQAAQRRAVTATLAVLLWLFMLLVFLPEELGDRPYDVFGLKF